MSLKDRIQDDMKSAMRAKAKDRLSTLRLMLAAIKQQEVDKQIILDDEQIIATLERMIKQRRESISHYQNANREELAAKEASEIEVIQTYMPEFLSDEEIMALVDETISVTNAQSMRDMGKVMGIVKQRAQGRADMTTVSALVKAKLAS
jgi:uncharacterized protein YqeY